MTRRRRSTDLGRKVSNIFSHHKRRAREARVELDYDRPALHRAASAAMDCPCPYCGIYLTPALCSCDHQYPTSRGGQHNASNLEWCCRRCNETKGALSRTEFLELLALLGSFPSQARDDILRRLRAGGRIRR